jgi:hypothetical protein
MGQFVEDENLPHFPNRTATSIESKCKKVLKQIGHFESCYRFAENNLPSGATEEDKRRLAHEEYTSRHSSDFKYDQAWIVMRNTPRWSFQQPLMHRHQVEQQPQPAPSAQAAEARNHRPRGRDRSRRNNDLASAVSHAGMNVADALGGVREAMDARSAIAQTQVSAIQEQNRILANQVAIIEQSTQELVRQNTLLNASRKRKERVSALRMSQEWVTDDNELQQLVRQKMRKSIKSILQSSLFASSDDDSDAENRRAN